jgi:hypothetical protein
VADITMCQGEGCPFKENCYRYKAPVGYWQSFFAVPPYNPITRACGRYWPIKEENKK